MSSELDPETRRRWPHPVWIVLGALWLIVIACMVVGLVILIRALPSGPAETGFMEPLDADDVRRRVERVSDMDKLQEWAIEIVRNPNIKLPTDEYGDIRAEDRDSLPPFVQSLRPGYIFVRGRGTDSGHVDFIWKDVVVHYGLMVGPPTFQTHSWNQGDVSMDVHKWRDGVYIHFGPD